MSDSAEGSARKASLDSPSGEGGAANLAPEEAERLAEAFIPSWQFDQAAFTPGVMSQEEMERLASPSSPPVAVAPIVGIGSPQPQTPGEEMTSSDVDVSGLEPKRMANTVIDASPPMAPPPSALAPLSRPITQPMVQPAAPAQAVSARGTLMMAGGPPAGGLGVPTSETRPPPPEARETKGRTVPHRSPPPGTPAHVGRPAGPQRTATPRRAAPAVAPAADDTGSLLLLKKSNKGPLLLGAIGIVAAVAIFAGVRAMSHDDNPQPTSATASPAPPPPARTEETVIPPPPPPTEPAAATAAATEATAEAKEPLPAPAPKPQPTPPPPPPPPRVAVAAPPPRAAEPPRAAPVRPAATPPKTSTKSSGGGIVRDNPF